jgi:hypothetical protein
MATQLGSTFSGLAGSVTESEGLRKQTAMEIADAYSARRRP